MEIKVPSVGESITEGKLLRWMKPEGAYVQANEPLFELETDKATTEVPSPAAGVLHIRATAGAQVQVGAVVGTIEEKAAPPAPEEKKPAATPRDQLPAKPEPAKSPPPAVPATAPVVSPAARHLAASEGVDVNNLTGSGRGGRILKEDVLAQLESRRPAAPASPPPAAASLVPAVPPTTPVLVPPTAFPARPETRQPMSGIRQRIAERLVQAQHTAAILTTFNEIDMSAVMALRARYKETFQKKHGVSLGFMSFFVKACSEALRAFPLVNARIEGSEIVLPGYHDMGIAVSTDKGLMVPVLRNAQALSFAEIEKGIAELGEKARSGKITVPDLQGGTFTITNGGVFGSLLSTPILNPPQSGILGMHAIQKRPVAIDDQVVIRPMMYVALSYDHRLIDGREAVSFLVRVKECVENPERLLLAV